MTLVHCVHLHETVHTSAILAEDLTYLGAFRLPNDGDRPLTFEYGGAAMTFRPDGDPGGEADGFQGRCSSPATSG